VPSASRVAGAGADALVALGVPASDATLLADIARRLAGRTLRLEPGCDAAATKRALLDIGGMTDTLATEIVVHALDWPDAFPASDPALVRAAEQWRPWRAYAALHLRYARLGEQQRDAPKADDDQEPSCTKRSASARSPSFSQTRGVSETGFRI
jgi:AraC family transcriptional regulator of adaptative response / DNA-3-methyladenine glycosylase II